MNKVKSAFAILLLGITIAISAFSDKPELEPKSLTQMWYTFNGGNVNNPEHYELLGDGTQAPLCDATTTIRCAVKAVQNQDFPEDNLPDLDDPSIIYRFKN